MIKEQVGDLRLLLIQPPKYLLFKYRNLPSSKPPPGDPHQNCTQFGDGRNGGLIVKRPLSNFVRQHK
jgi:hypothetical protein